MQRYFVMDSSKDRSKMSHLFTLVYFMAYLLYFTYIYCRHYIQSVSERPCRTLLSRGTAKWTMIKTFTHPMLVRLL